MKAPKLRGPFRNVRTAPRSFSFKSRHLSGVRPEWEERKRRVEEEVLGASDRPRTIKFRQGARDSEGRAARRAASVRAGRMAVVRATLVALGLVYLTYRGVLWVDAQNYANFLQFMQSNG